LEIKVDGGDLNLGKPIDRGKAYLALSEFGIPKELTLRLL